MGQGSGPRRRRLIWVLSLTHLTPHTPTDPTTLKLVIKPKASSSLDPNVVSNLVGSFGTPACRPSTTGVPGHGALVPRGCRNRRTRTGTGISSGRGRSRCRAVSVAVAAAAEAAAVSGAGAGAGAAAGAGTGTGAGEEQPQQQSSSSSKGQSRSSSSKGDSIGRLFAGYCQYRGSSPRRSGCHQRSTTTDRPAH